MADVADVAADYEAADNAAALAEQKRRAQNAPRLHPVGYCQNPMCCDDFGPGDARLFCDSVCAGEYQRVSRAKSL